MKPYELQKRNNRWSDLEPCWPVRLIMFQDLIRWFCKISLSSVKFEKWTIVMFQGVPHPCFSICQFDLSLESVVHFCLPWVCLFVSLSQTCPYMTMIITKDKVCDSGKIMQPFLWGISESWRIRTSQSSHFVGFSVVNPANQSAFVLFSHDSWLSNSRREESGFKCLRNRQKKTASVFSLNNGWKTSRFFFSCCSRREEQSDRQASKQPFWLVCVD